MEIIASIVLAMSALSAAAQDYPTPEPNPGPAEIQIFYGYRGYNNYDFKRVSTSTRPLSLGYILSGDRTAACFKGDPNTALELFADMVLIYNARTGRRIRIVGSTYYYYGNGKGALRFETVDEWNRSFLNFPRMIECDRWSKPFERDNY